MCVFSNIFRPVNSGLGFVSTSHRIFFFFLFGFGFGFLPEAEPVGAAVCAIVALFSINLHVPTALPVFGLPKYLLYFRVKWLWTSVAVSCSYQQEKKKANRLWCKSCFDIKIAKKLSFLDFLKKERGWVC